MAGTERKPPTLMIGAGIGAGIGLAMVIGRNIDSFALRVLIGAACGGVIGGIMVAIASLFRRKKS